MTDRTDELDFAEVLLHSASGIDRRDRRLFPTCFTEDVRADHLARTGGGQIADRRFAMMHTTAVGG